MRTDLLLACPLQDLHTGRKVLERDAEIEHQDALIIARAPPLIPTFMEDDSFGVGDFPSESRSDSVCRKQN
jgi:hypothetical protein